jgi:hypothetical protein
MKKKTTSSRRPLFFALALAVLALAACSQQADLLPRVWIDYPRENLRVAPDQPLLVTSHAYAASGIGEVVLSMDGVAYQRTQPAVAGDDFSEFQQEWLPPGEGTYVLQVVVYDSEGTRSNPATVTVIVGEQLAAEQPPEPPEEPQEEAPQEELEEQPTCPPLATVQSNANCRSGPGEIYPVLGSLPAGAQAEVVGQSQDGYWWVIDAAGGIGRCWIWEELVSLSNQECQIARVESPPPPQDLTAPPTPEPVVPANGLSISCRADQNLAWLPVQDESGIAGYDLKLEKELSPGNWSAVNQWSNIQGKQQTVPVNCGLRFRWAVRAVDGAGNLSPWSGYSSFSVELD